MGDIPDDPEPVTDRIPAAAAKTRAIIPLPELPVNRGRMYFFSYFQRVLTYKQVRVLCPRRAYPQLDNRQVVGSFRNHATT